MGESSTKFQISKKFAEIAQPNSSVAPAVGPLEGVVIRALKEIDQKSDSQIGS